MGGGVGGTGVGGWAAAENLIVCLCVLCDCIVPDGLLQVPAASCVHACQQPCSAVLLGSLSAQSVSLGLVVVPLTRHPCSQSCSHCTALSFL